MTVKKIKISEFGGLKDKEMEFSDSFNIINGDNESGKSTVLLFIVYMLYGLPSKRSGTAATDKMRSVSWDGSRAAGEMEIEYLGTVYRILRRLRPRGSVSEFEVIDTVAGKRVECDSPAELFLSGVSRETFESCCLCGQLRCGGINGAQVSAALTNLSLGADETVDAEKVIKTVREVKKEYRHERGKGGLIYETEEEIAALEYEKFTLTQKLAQLEELRAQYAEKSGELVTAQRRLEQVAKNLEYAEAQKKLECLSSLKKLRAEADALRQTLEDHKKNSFEGVEKIGVREQGELRSLAREYEKAKLEYQTAESENKDAASRFDSKRIKVALAIERDGGKTAYLERSRASVKKEAVLGGGFLALCALCALAVFAGIVLGMPALAVFAALGALSAVGAVICALNKRKLAGQNDMRFADIGTDREGYESFIADSFSMLEAYREAVRGSELAKERTERARESFDKVERMAQARLGECGIDKDAPLPKTLLELADAAERYFEKKLGIEHDLFLKKALIAEREKELGDIDEQALRSAIPPEKIIVGDVQTEYERAFSEQKALSESLVSLRIKLEGAAELGVRSSVLEADIADRKRLLAVYKEKHEIYEAACEALEAASENMKTAFAPKLRQGASELLERVSGGKYSRLYLSNSLEVSLEAGGAIRSADLMSAGTADMLYIALRMALIKSIFGGKAPLFMDETLAMLDDKRAGAVLELVSEYSEEGNQCLLFSCHDRENRLCDSLGINYNRITMK